MNTADLHCRRLNLLWAAKEALRKATGHRPLLGFLEMRLESQGGKTPGCGTLCFRWQRAGEQGRASVVATIEDGFALAYTCLTP